MQQRITEAGKLLDLEGNLIKKGYATELIREYDRADIKAGGSRIKEWDYYYIGNAHFGVALTVADNSYMSLVSASFLNFDTRENHTKSEMGWLTFGKLQLPKSSKAGDIIYQKKNTSFSFLNDGNGKRILKCKYKNFKKGSDFECELTLSNEPRDSMVIATPFAKSAHFYYNQKINCMRASGYAIFEGAKYIFEPEDSFAVLDWGRGVWTYNNTWYWGSASGEISGKTFGFNIGYGFGDTGAASENMIFYDGTAHKIEQVEFKIPTSGKGKKEDYLSEWQFTSSDGRFEMRFEPILDRYANSDVLIIRSHQHQVFGKFSGFVILDDGTRLEIQNLLGFAEKVQNRW